MRAAAPARPAPASADIPSTSCRAPAARLPRRPPPRRGVRPSAAMASVAERAPAKERFVVHTLSGYKIEGISVGGQETCVILPQLKVAFDSGRCPQRCVYADTLCLSHTHMDHAGGAGFYIATRALVSLPPPTILLPASRADAFQTFIASLRALDGSDLPHVPVPVTPGGEHRVSKRHLIRAFATTHPVPSQGYVVYGTKEKLLPEHAGKSGAEIKALREAGTRVTATVEVPEVAFTGDTAADWIDRALDGSDPVAADALRAKLLICECTFVDDRCTPEDARAYGHTHVDELVERAAAFENESILFIHFSARYKAEEIEAALAERLPRGLRERVTPLLVGFG